MTDTHTEALEPCPFCGDAMMWLDDAADEPVFAHEQTNILGATCFLNKAIFRSEHRDAWNTRAAIEALPARHDERAAYREGLLTAARTVRRYMGDHLGENSALMLDVDEGIQADKPTLAYVAESLERRAEGIPARNDERVLKLVEALRAVGYDRMFDALCKAVRHDPPRKDIPLHVSVERFIAALADTQPSGETR